MFSLKGLAAAFEPARKINWLGEDLRAGFGAYISSVLLHWKRGHQAECHTVQNP
jgi:hypothetical protein